MAYKRPARTRRAASPARSYGTRSRSGGARTRKTAPKRRAAGSGRSGGQHTVRIVVHTVPADPVGRPVGLVAPVQTVDRKKATF